MTTLRYTPTVQELLPDYKLACQQPNCGSIFSNAGNYDMHLQKCHNVTDIAKRSYQQFHCPHPSCVYNTNHQHGVGKFFKTMKYLRQHYRKVHCHKEHSCGRCTKKFATAGQLRSHSLNECGKTFACTHCSAQYDNLSALQVHAKRRGHKLPPEMSTRSSHKPAGQKRATTQSTQTEGSPCRLEQAEASAQTAETTTLTNNAATITLPQDFDDLHVYLRNIETQTEFGEDFHNLADWSLDNMAAEEQAIITRDPSCYDKGEHSGFSYTNDMCEASVQTETGLGLAASTGTQNVATTTIPQDFDELSMFWRNMETQTETDGSQSPRKVASTHSVATTTVPDLYDLQMLWRTTQHTQTEVPPSHNADIFDEMLDGRGTSMAAQQTSEGAGDDDDFLSELGLVDMQTQTNWSCAEWMPTTKSTSCAHDVLLVSTETQTSFAQCLLDYGAAHSGDPYTTTTQYTQTGDNPLEGLFDDPAATDDYIGGFQSSYTQT